MQEIGRGQQLFRAMTSPKIVGNGIKVSLVVGTVLNLINQGESLLAGHEFMIGSALLNYLVPFCVACYSGARALPIQEFDGSSQRAEGPDPRAHKH